MDLVRLGAFEVDLRAGELRARGRTTRLQDKPLQLLELLLEHPNELVTRDQIRERIWGPSRHHDFEDSLNQAVRKLREALRDDASNPRILETIPRRGYRLIAPVKTGRASAGAPPMSRRTVGREEQRRQLESLFEQASMGHGRLVCLSGEPGIGKTTLAETVLASIAAEGRSRIAIGRCSERFAGDEAYLPILEGIESLLGAPDRESVANLLRASAPSWYAELVKSADRRPVADGDEGVRAATQERRKREFVAFLEAAAAERPIVLFIDDLHWADPSSVDLLSYAVPRCQALPVMILVTYRPSDLRRTGHPFLQVKQELQAHRQCREIELSALEPADVDAYLSLEFPDHAFDREFAVSLYRRTEGHPLFLADLLLHLRNAGFIRRDGERWVLKGSVDEIEDLPDSVRAMVDRQIGNIGDEHRGVLELASIEGHQFHSAILAEVLGITLEQVEDALDDLHAHHGLVRPAGEHIFPDSTFSLRYNFSHSLYLNAVHARIRASRRADLSARVAAALAGRYEKAQKQIAAQLAVLFHAARDWPRASEFFTAAAGNASRLSAHREAVKLSTRAMEVAQSISGPPRDRYILEAMMQRAAARQALSEFSEAIQDFEDAATLAAGLGNVEKQVDAMCGAAFSEGYLKQTDRMRDRAAHAIEIATAAGASTAYPETVLGFQQILVGDLAGARANHERALTVLSRRPPSLPGIFAAVSFGFLNDLQSEYARADALLAGALDQIRASGCWSDYLRATWFHGMVLANQGRIGEALRTLTNGMHLAEWNGERYWYSRFPNTIGWIHAQLLNPELALRLNTEGVRAGIDGGTPEAEANSHINLANAYVTLGDLARAGEHLTEGERILNQEGHQHWLRWRFHIRLELETANYCLARGDIARAHAFANSALRRSSDALARKHIAAAHKLLGDIAMLQGRAVEGAAEYSSALAILDRHPCPVIEWACAARGGGCRGRVRRSRAGRTVQGARVRARRPTRKFHCRREDKDRLSLVSAHQARTVPARGALIRSEAQKFVPAHGGDVQGRVLVSG